uniref:DUF4939 domain-containing protein n=1 Tax=Crocodylus porosus TaxID=8502 RepID=A0A7M4E3A3_CROPO
MSVVDSKQGGRVQTQKNHAFVPTRVAAHLTHPKPQTLLPDKFKGNPYCFLGFINQCCLASHLCPRPYTSDMAKVGLIISLLSGDILAWDLPLLESANPLLDNPEDFIQAMVKIFGKPTSSFLAFVLP